MANLEFDYTDKDYQLIATQEQQTLGEQDYVRFIVYDVGGDIVRVIGYSLATDNDMIWFNPDNSWVEIA